MSTQKRSRCKNGTRKNKKTGNCESVLDKTCPICLDRIVSGNVKTKCKHNFHKKCLLGWCKANKEKPACPVCRRDIKATCKKITPFDSEEVFRYTFFTGNDQNNIDHSIDLVTAIIKNPDFDVNVKQPMSGKSILYELSENKYRAVHFAPLIEYLLKHPKIEISIQEVGQLIGSNNQPVIQLFKKHKKIPKALKGLI